MIKNYFFIFNIIFALAIHSQSFNPSYTETPTGFASVDTLGQNGTYGGRSGDTLTVTNGAELFDILDSRRDSRFNKNNPPLVILIEGKLTWGEDEMMDVKETYDLTILGKGDDAQIEEFGLNVYRSHNIIIRNIEFRNCHDDAINITDSLSHHIWVDHCTFSDDPESGLTDANHDGLLDIKNGASFVTVSWNHFYNHTKTCLLGASDNREDMDKGKLKVTYHHNRFDNTNQRHPRVRFGECHVFNNFYDNTLGLMDYGIASTMEADVVVEANYFLNVNDPTHVGQASSGPGDLIEFNNIYNNCGEPQVRGEAFEPSKYYSHTPDNPEEIPQLLKQYSGSGNPRIDTSVVKVSDAVELPENLILYQNYPNPFNPTTTIEYSVPNSGFVVLKVCDVLGGAVGTLVNSYQNSGNHKVKFDAVQLTSGVYIYRLISGTYTASKKMYLIK